VVAGNTAQAVADNNAQAAVDNNVQAEAGNKQQGAVEHNNEPLAGNGDHDDVHDAPSLHHSHLARNRRAHNHHNPHKTAAKTE